VLFFMATVVTVALVSIPVVLMLTSAVLASSVE